ncbi:hypothetical protein FACS1894180_2620 [Bacteroidia bacterium]|nr:hypothetical protein FACS1894180_2620 [Bacteroidia bacterium]
MGKLLLLLRLSCKEKSGGNQVKISKTIFSTPEWHENYIFIDSIKNTGLISMKNYKETNSYQEYKEICYEMVFTIDENFVNNHLSGE